ncbi:MAG TPA: NAD(P)H-quinone oxidoreductase [Pilimelia sp.]|nr:NAD(P)H-quinone oxidoreductase [Pilimelia sp.]
MHAITIPEPGGPDALVWAEVPDPEPRPDEVLIEVCAAGVNRADMMQRRGQYPPPAGAPPYPGLEVSGTIAGSGEQVCALLAGGGYAEKVAVPAGQVLPIPRGLTVTQAAALPEVACTVWSNVVLRAGLVKGETLLVHGGGSGIGTFAIQLGVALGCRVITTARRSKHERLKQLGAHVTVDYPTDDFAEQAGRLGGADVVLDIMGAAYLDRNIAALAPNGRIAVIGMQGGRAAELNLGALMAKRGSISATTLRARPTREKAEIVRGVREQVWPLVESGAIRPVIDRTVPLRRAAEAHRVLESGDHLGKILLVADER